MTGQQRPEDTRRKVRVAVIFGGQSGEHDVSLRSAQTVLAALDDDRFEAVPIGSHPGRPVVDWSRSDGAAHRDVAALCAGRTGGADAETLETCGVRDLPEPPRADLGADIDVVFPVCTVPWAKTAPCRASWS